MREQRYVRLTGSANPAEIRTALYEGREHLVVPVVALVGDSVIRAMNAPGPEFAASDVIARSAIEWDGRPCVGDHPKDENGAPVSATIPEVCERTSFGRIANARFERGKLQMEAWLDPSRAELVGDDAKRVLQRARAKQVIEVSIGAWVEVEKVNGRAPNGEPYIARWTDIGPNHLSLLPEGATGACSVESGCGAPRVAMSRQVVNSVARSKQLRAAKKEGPMVDSVKQTLRSVFSDETGALLHFRNGEIRNAAEDGVSDADLRGALDRELFAKEPGYLGIDAVFPLDGLVVYAVAPEQQIVLYRRGFTLADDGSVSLADEKEEVQPVTKYEPVAAASGVTTAAAGSGDCACHKTKGGSMSSVTPKVKELAARLIASGKSPYIEDDRKHLESLSEDRLMAFEAAFAGEQQQPTAPPQPPVPQPTPTPSPNPPVQQPPAPPAAPSQPTAPATPSTLSAEGQKMISVSEEEYATFRRLTAEREKQERQRKDALVAALKGAQKVHSEASLKSLSLDRLEEMAALLELEDEPSVSRVAANYIGKTLPMVSGDDEVSEPPDTWGLTAARAAKKSGSGKQKEVN